MTDKDLLDILEEYCGGDYIPMHMPGAKRNASLFKIDNPYSLDLTEIEGFDNMHHADGIIADAFLRCAKLFGADESLYLINGSSAGILAAVCGATDKKDTVIVARNCHISVYNAIYLNELNPVYIYPEYYMKDSQDFNMRNAGICGRISAEDIKNALKDNPKATAVIITSPTYEGLVSDIRQIAQVVHEHGAVLIVDEAHGAHFNFHEAFPDSANKCGADIVVQSIHKTLPAFTQTALLHMNGKFVNRERIKKYWSIFQTTSPSYILMSSIDSCVTLINSDGRKLFDRYVEMLCCLRKEIENLKYIKIMQTDDISKIVLITDDGKMLSNILRNKYHIELEMASQKYVIAMTSIGDTPQYYERFLAALREIDKNGLEVDKRSVKKATGHYFGDGKQQSAEQAVNVYEAENLPCEEVRLCEASGRISAGKICFYPPGIPLINSGEKFSQSIITDIIDGIDSGLEVMGINYREKEVMVRCLK